jgi:hypothetical protein
VPEVIRAQQFEVVDSAGRLTAELGVRGEGVLAAEGLRLFDEM